MQSEDTTKLSRFQERRQKLMEITADARSLRTQLENEAKTEAEALAWAATSLNELIVKYFYKIEDQKPLKTFKQWKDDNKKVKKGSKAFVLWGRPLAAQEKEGEENDDENGTFFPIVYLFSSAQVE